MPLFIQHRFLFIHIPKCGGDTISQALKSRGDHPLLFVADGSVMVNGHTPQHMTWHELKQMGWVTPPGFRVAALVRHPVHRVLSEFRYIHTSRPDLIRWARTPTMFLDHFLPIDDDAYRRFDFHNLDMLRFISDDNGEVNSSIYIQSVEDMDRWAQELNLPKISLYERRNVTQDKKFSANFSRRDIERIISRYRTDILWYETTFPKYRLPIKQHHGL